MTVVLVGDELAMPHQNLLEVRELCTINEEEEEQRWRGRDISRLMRLEEPSPGRCLALVEEEEGGGGGRRKNKEWKRERYEPKLEMISRIMISSDERMKSHHQHPAPIDIISSRRGEGSNCSSMVAEAGSMLASVVAEEQREVGERTNTDPNSDKIVNFKTFGLTLTGNENCHRNSTGGSSTSSGAFSGSSRHCSEESAEGVLNGENDCKRRQMDGDDDLPPQMPLIFAVFINLSQNIFLIDFWFSPQHCSLPIRRSLHQPFPPPISSALPPPWAFSDHQQQRWLFKTANGTPSRAPPPSLEPTSHL